MENMDTNFKIRIHNMFLDHGKHGQQFQNTKYVPGSWWTWEANTRLVFLSWVFLLLTLLWWEEKNFPFQRWENILILQMPEIELNLGNSKVKFEDIVANGLSRFVFSSTLVFFVGFRFIALLKDCVLTGRQVYCQVSQLWQSEQLNQVEHGLWQYGVNRWSVKFSISKLVTILAAFFS